MTSNEPVIPPAPAGAGELKSLASVKAQFFMDNGLERPQCRVCAQFDTEPHNEGCWVPRAIAIIQGQIDQLTQALTALREEWTESAERLRLGKGQRTREKRGHEVLASCAATLGDILTASSQQETK